MQKIFHFIIFVALLSVTAAARAADAYVELLSENDFWVLHGTDRYYTNGGTLSLSMNTKPNDVFAWLSLLLPPKPEPQRWLQPARPAQHVERALLRPRQKSR